MLGWPWNRRKLLANRALLGRWGEKRSERFLHRRGFRTLARNFSCKGGEIDLVMADAEGTVVFVEVKARGDEDFVPAESALTRAKQARMSRAAKYFLSMHRIEQRPCRFDVVAVVLGDKGPVQLRHYENAFVP